MPLTTNTLRNLFDAARADAAASNPTIAAEIKAMRFYDLPAKAADDVSDEHGEQAAANHAGPWQRDHHPAPLPA